MILKEQNYTHQIKLINIQLSLIMAGWQSGHAAACKAVNAGSIPASASIK